MHAKELSEWIDSLTDDIEFQYDGKYGVISPWNRQDISLCYDEQVTRVHSIDKAMTTPFIEGKTLEELVENIIFG